MRYLLIGGSGFIGQYLAAGLIPQHEITVAGRNPSFTFKNATYKRMDFTKCPDFTNYIEDTDVVIHMVSTIIPSDDLTSINQEIADNVFPSTILFENAARLGKKIVFISSGGTIYGNSATPNSEQSPTNPICNYGISKLIIEKYLSMYHHFYGLDYKIIRLSNPYSEKTYRNKKQGIIPIIVDNIIHKKPINIWGKDQIRDYIHIEDAINGILAVLNYSGQSRVFNVGSGVGHSVNYIIDLVSNRLDQKALIKYSAARKCDVQKNILDIHLITQETGWTPKISLSQGINKIISQLN